MHTAEGAQTWWICNFIHEWRVARRYYQLYCALQKHHDCCPKLWIDNNNNFVIRIIHWAMQSVTQLIMINKQDYIVVWWLCCQEPKHSADQKEVRLLFPVILNWFDASDKTSLLSQSESSILCGHGINRLYCSRREIHSYSTHSIMTYNERKQHTPMLVQWVYYLRQELGFSQNESFCTSVLYTVPAPGGQ